MTVGPEPYLAGVSMGFEPIRVRISSWALRFEPH